MKNYIIIAKIPLPAPISFKLNIMTREDLEN